MITFGIRITRIASFFSIALALLIPSDFSRAQDNAIGLAKAKKDIGRLLSIQNTKEGLQLNRKIWVPNEKEQKRILKEQKEQQKKMAKQLNMQIGNLPAGFLPFGQDATATGGLSDLFSAVITHSSNNMFGGGSGSSQSGNRFSRSVTNDAVSGRIEWVKNSLEFQLRFSESIGQKQLLYIEEDEKSGMMIRYENPMRAISIIWISSADGYVNATIRKDSEFTVFNGLDAKYFFLSKPDEINTLLLQPLVQLGIRFEPHKYHPLVISIATTGFSSPSPEVQSDVDRWILQLSDEDQDARDDATEQLKKLFPQASNRIVSALEETQDLEAKMRLKRVIAAYPERGRMFQYVVQEKLHEDTSYLLEILGSCENYKAAAQKRLTVLLGKDYGKNPKDWPIKK